MSISLVKKMAFIQIIYSVSVVSAAPAENSVETLQLVSGRDIESTPCLSIKNQLVPGLQIRIMELI